MDKNDRISIEFWTDIEKEVDKVDTRWCTKVCLSYICNQLLQHDGDDENSSSSRRIEVRLTHPIFLMPFSSCSISHRELVCFIVLNNYSFFFSVSLVQSTDNKLFDHKSKVVLSSLLFITSYTFTLLAVDWTFRLNDFNQQ